jgi:hypothetical protein
MRVSNKPIETPPRGVNQSWPTLSYTSVQIIVLNNKLFHSPRPTQRSSTSHSTVAFKPTTKFILWPDFTTMRQSIQSRSSRQQKSSCGRPTQQYGVWLQHVLSPHPYVRPKDMGGVCGDFQPLRHNGEQKDDEGQKNYFHFVTTCSRCTLTTLMIDLHRFFTHYSRIKVW